MSASLEGVNVLPPQEKHRAENRTFQGIPGIAATAKGRLFSVCYGGRDGEGPDNYVTLFLSDDEGTTWSQEVAVVDPPHPNVRAFDPVVWLAPDGRFLLFWAQSYSEKRDSIFDGRAGVWCSVLLNPDDDPAAFRWSESVRLCDGIMMNKPTVLADGAWALPVSVWNWKQIKECHRAPKSSVGAKIVVSEDGGSSFHERGKVVVPDDRACFDEHTILERNDGRLHMVIRVNGGNMESFSADRGRTWSTPADSPITGPNSRLFLRRLRSGRLLLVNHDYTPPKENPPEWGVREKLTAWLSEDDGQTWPYRLLLDAREGVSYPDAVEDANGNVRIIYDYERYKGGFIIMIKLTEGDIMAGRPVSKTVVSRTGVPGYGHAT